MYCHINVRHKGNSKGAKPGDYVYTNFLGYWLPGHTAPLPDDDGYYSSIPASFHTLSPEAVPDRDLETEVSGLNGGFHYGNLEHLVNELIQELREHR